MCCGEIFSEEWVHAFSYTLIYVKADNATPSHICIVSHLHTSLTAMFQLCPLCLIFFFFTSSGNVRVFQGALLNSYCSPKYIWVTFVMNFALKGTHLNILIKSLVIISSPKQLRLNWCPFLAIFGNRVFNDSVMYKSFTIWTFPLPFSFP